MIKELKNKNKNISSQIKKGFFTTSVLVAIIGGLGYGMLAKSSFEYVDLYGLFGTARANIYNVGYSFLGIAELTDRIAYVENSDINTLVSEINSRKDYLKENLDTYSLSVTSDDGLKFLADLNSMLDELYSYSDQIINFAKNKEYNKAQDILDNNVTLVVDNLKEHLSTEFSWHEENAPILFDEVDSIVTITKTLLLLGTLINIVVAIYIGKKVSKSIKEPMKDLVTNSKKLSEGDLSVKFKVYNNDELGQIATELNHTIDTLNEIIKDISNASSHINMGSAEISSSSQILADGSTQQASAVEELSASIQDITNQTDNNAQNAIKATELVHNTKERALEGNKYMLQMVDATEEIQKASMDISRIIETIDNIAFQTNVLALNASVEAARAGQHGKGFAVVADEVRNLAVRSATAVKETTDLIENSLQKTKIGAELAKETAEYLNNIVNDVTTITEIIDDIANSSNDQFNGIQQINIGLSQVSEVIQTTTATSQENAASSLDLAEQSKILNKLIYKFKLKK